MRCLYWACFVVIFNAVAGFAQQQNDSAIYLADPTIFSHNGKFYLYGTDGFTTDSGFHTYVSGDLYNWKLLPKRALTKGESFGTKGFWAPQVLQYHHKCYMAYTANENIAIAESKSPSGPFTQKLLKQLEAPVKQIDPFVFKDEDGRVYFYHVRLQEGNRIFGAEMETDLSAIKTGTLRECISAVTHPQQWENTQSVKWTVTEGPTVFKKGGTYYMLYSANDFRNPDYAVGYATASHPLGPWVKHTGNPIISRHITGANGSGHGDLLKGKEGKWYYVFHTHNSSTRPGPRRTAIIELRFEGDSIVADKESFRYLSGGQRD
ncbi:MAG: glycoside hydrolase family 43 protein [Agriterribacter sp.]